MLGLLMMAGLGFAATALMDHGDHHPSDEPHSDEDEAPHPLAHGSLLDEHGNGAQHDTTSHDTLGEDHAMPVAHHAQADSHAAEKTDTDTQDTSAAPDKSAPAPLGKVFGGEGNDTLQGSDHADLMAGNGGDDVLHGKMGNDNLIAFDDGKDTLFGDRGDDTLHGFVVQHDPDDTSFVIEDHQADHLYGGLGNDKLLLGSDDVATGGRGHDEFHVSWDVDHGHPAQITDYNPKQDKLFVEFTNHHADEGLTDIKPEDSTLTTALMKDGSGTAIMLNGQTIAHVLGATNLKAADIGLILA